MIARVNRIQVRVDKLDEFKKIWDTQVIPDVKQRKGFRSSYLLTDRKTGNCIGLAFWDTENDILADEKSGQYQTRANMVKNLCVAPITREIYEVASEF